MREAARVKEVSAGKGPFHPLGDQEIRNPNKTGKKCPNRLPHRGDIPLTCHSGNPVCEEIVGDDKNKVEEQENDLQSGKNFTPPKKENGDKDREDEKGDVDDQLAEEEGSPEGMISWAAGRGEASSYLFGEGGQCIFHDNQKRAQRGHDNADPNRDKPSSDPIIALLHRLRTLGLVHVAAQNFSMIFV